MFQSIYFVGKKARDGISKKGFFKKSSFVTNIFECWETLLNVSE